MTNNGWYRRGLVVASEDDCAELIAPGLAGQELELSSIESFTETIVALQNCVPDVLILCCERGETFCSEAVHTIREISRVPVLVVCRNDAGDHIAGVLAAGADDHIPRTVRPSELGARVHALLRRNQQSPYSDSDQIRAGDLRLDCRRATCAVNGAEIDLTPYAVRLLRALALQAGEPVTHDQLIEQVWGSPYHATTDNLRKLVQRVRGSLRTIAGPSPAIVSVARLGYRLDVGRNGHDIG